MSKTYVGIGRQKQGKYGSYLTLTLFAKDLDLLAARTNDRGSVTMVITERREPSAKGYTHYGYLMDDDDGQGARDASSSSESQESGNLDFNDEPF